MEHLLCRNTVKDCGKWRGICDGDKAAHVNAGLMLTNLWRDSVDANTVWFLFSVADRTKANAFITAPDAEEQAEKSGVIDGEYHFIASEAAY